MLVIAALLLFAQTPGTYPFASDRAVVDADLDGKTPDELRVMRNEVFARHGMRFKTPEMKAHFEKQPWYHGTADDVNAKLSPVERANVTKIKAREDALAKESDAALSAMSPSELCDALCGAASDGSVARIKTLLAAGADPDGEDEYVGNSAIHCAASKAQVGAVKALLAGGASVDKQGRQQQTALAIAVSNGYVDLAKALLAAGADPDLRLTCGTETALGYARAGGKSDMVKLLQKHGAKDFGEHCTAD